MEFLFIYILFKCQFFFKERRYLNIILFFNYSSATISVTLRNRGPDAYEPEKFGKKIIVERLIDQNGKANYKLKSEQGI